MKKHLLLFFFVLTGLFESATASFQPGNWRWRNDDGSETSATWKAPINTSFELIGNSAFRLRFETGYTSTETNHPFSIGLSYSKDGTNFTALQTAITSNNEHFLIASVSNSLTNGEATTDQFSTDSFFSSYIFVPGSSLVGYPSVKHAITQSTRQEFEFVIIPTEFIEQGTKYTFSVGGLTPSDSSIPPITLTTPSVLPVKLSSFNAQKTINGINLKWQTISETDNERFDIERSTNGKNWSVIKSIPGKGTQTTASDYIYLDTAPANGKNYYRIAQVDVSGKTNRSYTVEENYLLASAISVYPNPFADKLWVKLPAYSGKTVTVSLSDLQGRTFERKTLEVKSSAVEFIPTSGLKSGYYILSLSGTGLNYSTRILLN